MTDDIIIHNGVVAHKSDLSLPEFDRGLYYGDGCFETFRSYKGKHLCVNRHINRLAEAIEYLGIDFVLPNASTIQQILHKLLHLKHLNNVDAFVRIQVYRSGGRGFTPDSVKAGYIIEAGSLKESKASYSLLTSTIRSIPEAALSRKYKLSNNLNYIKAASEASNHGKDGALMLTIDGKVSETELANIFWYKEGIIYTPSEHCDILPGITRGICIDLAKESVEVREGEFEPEELANAEAVWLTNSLKEIIPVSSIDEQNFDTLHAVLLELQKQFEAYRDQHLI